MINNKFYNNMYLGTHNSGTGEALVWWQRPFGWFINAVSKCQSRTVLEQLNDGIRLFDFQIALYQGDFVFSHGLAIYNTKLEDALTILGEYSSRTGNTLYLALSLDRNFLLDSNIPRFIELTELVKSFCNRYNIVLIRSVIEKTGEYLYKAPENSLPSISEKYWTILWAKNFRKSWLDYIPLPKRHAKKYNKHYIDSCSCEYLMLDFYDLQK